MLQEIQRGLVFSAMVQVAGALKFGCGISSTSMGQAVGAVANRLI